MLLSSALKIRGKRARSLAEYLDAPIAIIDYPQDDALATKVILSVMLKVKKLFLIDDIFKYRTYLL